MSRAHDGHRQFFPSGNPFRLILPRGSHIPPKYAGLLSSFEEKLGERFKNLMPRAETEILSLPWMCDAMESLSATHIDIKNLITDLQFPVSDWDGQWMDMYLDNSVKLLDLCISFSSEISRLDQAQLLLQYALHVVDSDDFPSTKQLGKVRTSLSDWMQQINSKNPKLESSYPILNALVQSLDLPKVKNSTKGKILMRAMNGVKVQTVFICTVVLAAFVRSSAPLMDLKVPNKFSWAESFTILQTYANSEIRGRESSSRRVTLRELEAVTHSTDKLHRVIHMGDKLSTRNEDESSLDIEGLDQCAVELGEAAEKLADGMSILSKRVDEFFQIVLAGRDALLCNLRASDLMQGNLGEVKRFR